MWVEQRTRSHEHKEGFDFFQIEGSIRESDFRTTAVTKMDKAGSEKLQVIFETFLGLMKEDRGELRCVGLKRGPLS